MTDRTLPEDLSRWPDDPYELLGVSQQADLKTVRRVYFRLVRLYKPDHAPQQFQKIRTAFDAVQQVIQWREKCDPSWRDDDEQQEEDFAEQKDEESVSDLPKNPFQASNEELHREPFVAEVASLDDTCEELWQHACDGNEELAYEKLAAIVRRGQAETSVYIRLYWLLKVSPQLDMTLSPCEWLCQGLQQSALTGPLCELYRREILANPNEVLQNRSHNLIDCQAEAGALFDHCDSRWKAYNRLGRYDLISDELHLLRPRFHYDDEETGCRFMLLALDHLAWSNQESVEKEMNRYLLEIGSLTHLHLDLGDHLDRLELLCEASEVWKREIYIADIPRSWKQLPPLCWCFDISEIRGQLFTVLKEMAADPQKTMKYYDNLVYHSPSLATIIGSTFDVLRYDCPFYDQEQRTEDQIHKLVEKFLYRSYNYYKFLREELLQFCIDEAIDPENVGAIADEIADAWGYDDEPWSSLIEEDLSLRHTYMAYRAFWG